MWSFQHSVIVKASKSAVWKLWSDVEGWPKWDTDLKEAALHGEFEVGAEGKMKVADDAVVSFIISEIVLEERMTTTTRLFGATLSCVHEMTEEEEGLRITHRAELSGMLSFFWRFIVAKKIQKTISPALDTLAALAVAQPDAVATPEASSSSTESDNAVNEESVSSVVEAPVVPQPQAAVEAEKELLSSEGDQSIKTPELVSDKPAVEGASTEKEEDTLPEASHNDEKEPTGGDVAENALREKDMHEQIEKAAEAAVPPLPKKPVATEPVADTSEVKETEEVVKEASEEKKEDASTEPLADATTPVDSADEPVQNTEEPPSEEKAPADSEEKSVEKTEEKE